MARDEREALFDWAPVQGKMERVSVWPQINGVDLSH